MRSPACGIDGVTEAPPRGLHLLGNAVVVSAIALILAGVAWHGVTLDDFRRIWKDLLERPAGSISFRFVLQPLMAAIVAFRDGRRDVLAGRPPFLWAMLRQPQQRLARLEEALNATARIILLGLAMDAIYQLMAFPTFYPVEALLVALLLAFVPYLLTRGLVVRAYRGYAIVGGPR